MHRIEGLGLLAGHADAFLANDAKSGLLDQRIDRAGQIARGRVGLDNRKGALNRHDFVLAKRWWELRGLYRRLTPTASDQAKCAGIAGPANEAWNDSNFIKMNPV